MMPVIVVTQSERKFACTQDNDCTKHLNKLGSYGEVLCMSLFFPSLLISFSQYLIKSNRVIISMQMN